MGVSEGREFTQHFREVFDHKDDGRSAGDQLLALRQGSQSAADYALHFRTLAATSGWNDAALLAVFHQGLNADLKSELACREGTADLEQFLQLAVRLDNLLRTRRPTRTSAHNYNPPLAAALRNLCSLAVRNLPWRRGIGEGRSGCVCTVEIRGTTATSADSDLGPRRLPPPFR